jgi:hypothetical protein
LYKNKTIQAEDYQLMDDLSSHRLEEGQTIGASNNYHKIIDDGEHTAENLS